MIKKITTWIAASLLISVGTCFAGLEPASVTGYSAFKDAIVSLVVSDENGAMGVLLTNKSNASDRMWFWTKSDARCNADGYKALLSTALAAMAQHSLVTAIVVSVVDNHDFMDSSAKGTRRATNRLAQLWAEGPY